MRDQGQDGKRRSVWERLTALYSLMLSPWTPTRPHEVAATSPPPSGLSLIYSAGTTAEAELIRQVLAEAGFHVEYVPPVTTGLFGTSGSVDVFVKGDEVAGAGEFLREYLHAPPGDTGEAIER